MIRMAGVALAVLVMGAGPVAAETVLAEPTPSGRQAAALPQGGGTGTGAYERLTAGNRKVAVALYEAQPRKAAEAWPLDRIAEARRVGRSWGQIFKSMKAEGLIRETTLGAVVAKYGDRPGPKLRTAAAPVPKPAERPAAATQSAAAEPAPEAVGGASGRIGAFDELPPAEATIAEALFDAQRMSEDSADAWSLDAIATARQSGMDWGAIFKAMKEDGLLRQGGLGQVTRGRNHSRKDRDSSGHGGDIVVTTAIGKQIVVGSGGPALETATILGGGDDRDDKQVASTGEPEFNR